MINIANRHPKLYFFQAVTDFMKIVVGMSISNVYHPNSHSCMHTFSTTTPTSFYNFNYFLHLFMLMILHFITARKVESFARVYHLCVYVHSTLCTQNYNFVSLPIVLFGVVL